MREKFLLLILMLSAMLLTGAIGKYYVHSQNADGSATLTLFAKTAGLDDVDYSKLAEICGQKEYGCSADQENFSISVSPEKGRHYLFYAEYGFPDIVYTLELNAIATDLLTEKTMDVLEAAGQPVVFTAGEPLDLAKNDPESAQLLRQMGDISVIVQMPGEIVETNVGEKSGNTVAFVLSQAYMKDGSVVIKSRQLNSLYIIGVLMVLALLGIGIYFLKEKKEGNGGMPYAAKKPKAARKR